MTKANQSRRLPIDRAISDPALPVELRRDLSAALDAAVAADRLYRESTSVARELLHQRDDYRQNEPHRIVDLLIRSEPITLSEVLDDWPRREADHAHAMAREHATRVAADRMWQIVSSRVFRDHADEILRTIAATIAAGESPTEAQVDAWQKVTGMFSWNLPTIHPVYRFRVLSADRLTPAMRRVWEAVHAGKYQIEDQTAGKSTLRVTEYWPDLAESNR